MRELEELKSKNINIYPIKELVNTREKNYNLDRINSLNDLNTSLVYNSVLKCLEILDTKKTKFKSIIAQTILWMDVAKSGSKKDIAEWKKLGFNLFTHNIGSAQIYRKYSSSYDEIIYVLIKTHGLIGQYIKGEVNLNTNKELYTLIEKELLTKEELKEILLILNECIIREVSDNIYEKEKNRIEEIADRIVNNDMEERVDIISRLNALNVGISEDEKELLKDLINNKEVMESLEKIFNYCELWYYKSALKFLSIERQVKVLLLISNYIDSNSEITFESLMKDIYLNYKNVKRINIYKQRIIESYLDQMTYQDIINKVVKENINITYTIKRYTTTIEFNFEFSKVATKLIEFCEVAYRSGNLYNKSVILLYDLFGFRKDNYDRFYNEIEYLETMNSSINHKSKLLEFIKGNNVLDVGPGGGALMDLILDTFGDKNVYGIDISDNVIEELNKKKIKENRDYKLIKGNALNLEEYFSKGSIDTIIYSSIIHELFSYIVYNGKKFNHDVIVKTLKSAYNIIPVGGRIIIRDGIMSDKSLNRIIEFKNKNDMNILKRYKNDFKGRNIKYEVLSENKVKMNINDAMEFLYTYTWGEESYSLEVQEQFGYYTPNEYEQVVLDNLRGAKIIFSSSFLQEGYEEHLLKKISFYDEDNNTVRLPDSTYILVIEKRRVNMQKEYDSEEEFLRDYDSSQYDKPSITSDIALFSVSDEGTSNYRKLSKKYFSVLLVKRKNYPFKDKWCLPGGFVKIDETSEDAARRVLASETNLHNVFLEQLYTFDSVDRDPRCRVFSITYMGLVDKNKLDDSLYENASWFNITSLEDEKAYHVTLDNGNEQIKFVVKKTLKEKTTDRYRFDVVENDKLAFDHPKAIIAGMERLKNKINYTDIVFNMIGEYFTLGELQQVYEVILGKKLLDPAFRRIIAGKVIKTDKMQTGGGHRPSVLFTYKGNHKK